jgi:hypothetical protein
MIDVGAWWMSSFGENVGWAHVVVGFLAFFLMILLGTIFIPKNREIPPALATFRSWFMGGCVVLCAFLLGVLVMWHLQTLPLK